MDNLEFVKLNALLVKLLENYIFFDKDLQAKEKALLLNSLLIYIKEFKKRV